MWKYIYSWWWNNVGKSDGSIRNLDKTDLNSTGSWGCNSVPDVASREVYKDSSWLKYELWTIC